LCKERHCEYRVPDLSIILLREKKAMENYLQRREILDLLCGRSGEVKDLEELQNRLTELFLKDVKGGKLYKYRTVNKYSISNLKDGTLYCAVPSSFNDPFDCHFGVEYQSIISTLIEKDLELMGGVILKAGQFLMGKISLDECTETEKQLCEKWLRDSKKNDLVKRINQDGLAEQEAYEVLVSNYQSAIEMISDVCGIGEIRENFRCMDKFDIRQLEERLSEEQIKCLLTGEVSLRDYLKWFGFNGEADEISAITSVVKAYSPERAEDARELDGKYSKVYKMLAQNIDRAYRVGCLSTDYKNRLMWSHYADSHKGFCIEYDFCAEVDIQNEMLVLPVIYSKERVKIPWDVVMAYANREERDFTKEKRIMLELLVTKDKIWEYENEWRVIVTNVKGKENIKMPPISCIYIGALCCPKNKAMLINIARQLNIPIKQMVIDRGIYELHAQEI